MLPRYTPVFILYRGISEIADPVAIFFISSIITLGKAIAAQYIFYAAAVLTVPNVGLVAGKMRLLQDRY